MFSPTCKEEQLQGRHAMLCNETRLLRAVRAGEHSGEINCAEKLPPSLYVAGGL